MGRFLVTGYSLYSGFAAEVAIVDGNQASDAIVRSAASHMTLACLVGDCLAPQHRVWLYWTLDTEITTLPSAASVAVVNTPNRARVLPSSS